MTLINLYVFTGPYGCIGKPLALMQIRTLVAKIVTNFDVSFAPGEDGTNLMDKSRDHFTIGLADLNLVFKKR
jgi:cytochrome P450 family 628